MEKIIVGCLETCALPELGIEDLQVRVDTGAKTSSLHVDSLKKITKNGKPWIQFDIHPDIYDVAHVMNVEAPLSDIRRVKSSNGATEQRYVITTLLRLAEDAWPIEISLTDRSDMSYLMLLGREGMSDRLLVDPSRTFILQSNNSD
uniref:ATP-dependent zinc protease family protein n=1 Tax=Kordiimonas aquimaris TaxID=707591 RepID=UPI00374D38DB